VTESPIERLENFARERVSLDNTREVLQEDRPYASEIRPYTVHEDFYSRKPWKEGKESVDGEEGRFLVDDCIWHDLFSSASRSFDPLKIDNELSGYMKERYTDPDIRAKRSSGTDKESGLDKEFRRKGFNYTDIVGLLKEADSVMYPAGLRRRMVDQSDHSTQAAELFMDQVEEIADPVGCTQMPESRYPVDAGIARKASQEGLDVVTYDRDFLDTDDPIWRNDVDVYTPHQATEMMNY
jgi:hypothetical protein